MICEIHIYVNPEHFSLPSPSLFVCVCVSSSAAAAFMWNYKRASIFICVCALDIYGSIQCQNHNSSFTLNNPLRLVCTFSPELDLLLLPIKPSAHMLFTHTQSDQCWIWSRASLFLLHSHSHSHFHLSFYFLWPISSD